MVFDPAEPQRVLHVLAVSLPHQNGYTVRSRYVLATQAAAGTARPLAITSPYYPGNPAAIEPAEIAGVRHLRVPHPSDQGWLQAPSELACKLLYAIRKSSLGLAVHRRLVGMRDSRDGGAAPTGPAAPDVPAWRRLAKGMVKPLLRLGPVARILDSGQRWLERLEERLLTRRFRRAIEQAARAEGVDLIHAHSPYRSGLPAVAAARALGLPVVYEVRGLWEESAVASGRFERGDARYRHWRRRETETMRGADAVVTIGEALRDEVVSRGVDRSRVFVAPNGVDPSRFQPPRDDAALDPAARRVAARLAGTVLGYVGSIRALEGVDELVRGAAAARAAGHDVSLLVVGDGPELPELEELADELGLGVRAIFTGRVPHDRVADYYRLIDLFVVSRPDTEVTRTVTPLKPLEALASAKTLIVSDLPALREMVSDGETGLAYRAGDPDDLARQVGRLVEDPDLARRLAAAGRRWVVEERTWERSLAVLPEAYRTARRHAAGDTETGAIGGAPRPAKP